MKLQKNRGNSPSYFITIPSALIKAKSWKKGDDIAVEIDKKGDLVLKKKE